MRPKSRVLGRVVPRSVAWELVAVRCQCHCCNPKCMTLVRRNRMPLRAGGVADIQRPKRPPKTPLT
jgi:hypothetical protein